MDNHSIDNQLNSILLKPRFRFDLNESKDVIVDKFKKEFQLKSTKFRGKVVGDHVIIDIAKENEHLWSPQLQLELEEVSKNQTLVKGLFGPKPQLWTLFMFIHFGVALAFAVFATIFYTDWSLGQDYTFSLFMVVAMPILWISFYFFGRWGKKKGHQQIVELDSFMRKILED